MRNGMRGSRISLKCALWLERSLGFKLSTRDLGLKALPNSYIVHLGFLGALCSLGF
jgi:hypothetical protein